MVIFQNKLSLAWAGGRHARGAAKRTLCTAQMCRGCNTVVIVSHTKLLGNVWWCCWVGSSLRLIFRVARALRNGNSCAMQCYILMVVALSSIAVCCKQGGPKIRKLFTNRNTFPVNRAREGISLYRRSLW